MNCINGHGTRLRLNLFSKSGNNSVAALDSRQQMNVRVDDEGHVGPGTLFPAFNLEAGGLTQVGEKAEVQRSFMSFEGIEFSTGMSHRREGEGEAVVVYCEVFSCSNGTPRLAQVTFQSIDGVQLDFVLILLDICRDFSRVRQVDPEGSNDRGCTGATAVDKIEDGSS